METFQSIADKEERTHEEIIELVLFSFKYNNCFIKRYIIINFFTDFI